MFILCSAWRFVNICHILSVSPDAVIFILFWVFWCSSFIRFGRIWKSDWEISFFPSIKYRKCTGLGKVSYSVYIDLFMHFIFILQSKPTVLPEPELEEDHKGNHLYAPWLCLRPGPHEQWDAIYCSNFVLTRRFFAVWPLIFWIYHDRFAKKWWWKFSLL